MESNPDQLYREREQRVNDAIQLKVPDRVPFCPFTHYYACKHVGITFEEAWYSAEKWFGANKKMNLALEPDLYLPGVAIFDSGQAFEAVDLKQLKWPGHGVSPTHSHQFVEEEYMKADEYDALLADPSGFALRTYLPRICGTLGPLRMLPPLQLLLMGYGGLSMAGALAMPEIVTALESFGKMALESAKWQAANVAYDKEMKELGFPAWTHSMAMNPFDLISDMLRGMRGAMLDMFRQPDKLLETIDRLYPVMLGMALSMAKTSENPRVFMALHRGADGFMSLEQFETFYWASLKRLILDLIDHGLTPCLFFEGKYDQRLEYLAELPRGKVLGLFDRSDVFKAKEVLGDTMCIAGNMPLSLLKTGTPEQVKDYSKKLIDVVGRDGGFIMSSATVMDEADPELVNIWKDFTREYGVYK